MKKYFVIMIIATILQTNGCFDESSNLNYDIRTTINFAFETEEKISPVGIYQNSLTLLPNIYDSLVELDETSQFVPSIAESWNNLDEKIWRFQIRENVLFHNGQMLTAEDISFSFYEHYSLSILIENITIVDTYLIDVTTKELEPAFLYKIANSLIVFPNNYSLIDNDYWHIGTGPYKLSEYVEGNYSKLTYFEDYWGEKPSIDTIYFYKIENATERLNSLINGEIDLISYIINENISNISDLNSIKIIKYSPLSTYIF